MSFKADDNGAIPLYNMSRKELPVIYGLIASAERELTKRGLRAADPRDIEIARLRDEIAFLQDEIKHLKKMLRAAFGGGDE